MRVLLLGLVCMLPAALWAIPQIHLVQGPGQKSIYIDKGEFRGGLAQRSFQLGQLKRFFSGKNKTERFILNFKDGSGDPLVGRPGYYIAKLDPAYRRVVLEFSQIVGSQLDSSVINKIAAESKFFNNIKMTYDPVARTLSLQMSIKPQFLNKIKMQVFELDPKLGGGRLGLDIRYTGEA